MNKQEFLEELRKGLSGLPKEDVRERLNFYGEIIDDRIEEGLTEEEAVFGAFVGSSVGIFASGIIVVCGNTLSGVAMISAAMVLAGTSVFMFYGCNAATKGVLALTKKMAIWIKNCFIGKEKA
ncbi:MAG: hypothetical protein IKU61_01205 [Clostridia bacterium]|nr:hypothetical protein [Clostridia bacterium]